MKCLSERFVDRHCNILNRNRKKNSESKRKRKIEKLVEREKDG